MAHKDMKSEPGFQIKSVAGRILFVSCSSNMRIALQEAIRDGADLYGADLYGADLYGANLRDTDLYGANLRDANLRGADLHGANLYGANLYGANLYGADLYGANLRGADLRDTDLRDTDLRDTDLRDTDLRDANLRDTDLRGADLYGANLYGANLYGADLYGADLYGADLHGANGAELAIANTRILPEGDIIGWKKALDGRLVQLRIPTDARRSHGCGRKCRAEYAEVIAISDSEGCSYTEAFSTYDTNFRYETGATVIPTKPFDEDMWNECGSGIHFYITRSEAEHHH